MTPHESPNKKKNQFVAIRAFRGLCGIGVLLLMDRRMDSHSEKKAHLHILQYLKTPGLMRQNNFLEQSTRIKKMFV